MSKVKNISGGELDVPLLGRSVKDGEVAEVPDFQAAHTAEEPLPIVWPPDKWAPADPPGPALAVYSPASAATPEGM
jgi:hypothetical protein